MHYSLHLTFVSILFHPTIFFCLSSEGLQGCSQTMTLSCHSLRGRFNLGRLTSILGYIHQSPVRGENCSPQRESTEAQGEICSLHIKAHHLAGLHREGYSLWEMINCTTYHIFLFCYLATVPV